MQYTDERNAQILIYLMKAHGIKKVIASPGATNVCFIASLQQDPYFEIYSSVDERSAAYMACGLAAESGEAVALSCTGATASRNYVPGLTEAYYRQLPVLAITSSQHMGRTEHYYPQFMDRRNQMNDIVKYSAQLSDVHNAEDEWACAMEVNRALLELFHHNGGPVHINLVTHCSNRYDVNEIPPVPVVRRFAYGDTYPDITENSRIAIFAGAMTKWPQNLTEAVEAFCEKYNAIVLCDHTSGYKGKYRVLPNLICNQEEYVSPLRSMDLLIHIGQISGAYMSLNPKEVWRVHPDGVVRDTFRKLHYVFECREVDFFRRYVEKADSSDVCADVTGSYLSAWKEEEQALLEAMPEVPFSNVWIAQHTVSLLPENSEIHLGILNSLRSWNLFEMPNTVFGYSNTGGFGIDGNTSSLLGASLANPHKIYFGVVGDLSFFYDMNSIGNRYVGNNIRLMVINNGRGTEFRNYFHAAARFGEDTDKFIAAAGHFGKKSHTLLRHYAEDLGFEYLTASNKEEYLTAVKRFVTPNLTDKPMLFEVFTDSKDESDALKLAYHIKSDMKIKMKKSVKQTAYSTIGEKNVSRIKKLLGR